MDTEIVVALLTSVVALVLAVYGTWSSIVTGRVQNEQATTLKRLEYDLTSKQDEAKHSRELAKERFDTLYGSLAGLVAATPPMPFSEDPSVWMKGTNEQQLNLEHWYHSVRPLLPKATVGAADECEWKVKETSAAALKEFRAYEAALRNRATGEDLDQEFATLLHAMEGLSSELGHFEAALEDGITGAIRDLAELPRLS